MSDSKLTLTRVLAGLGFLAFIWVLAYIILQAKYPGQSYIYYLASTYTVIIGAALFFAQWIIIPKISFFSLSNQIVLKSMTYGAAFITGYFPGWLMEIMWKYSLKNKTDLISYTTQTIKNLISAPFTGRQITEAIPQELINAFTSIFAVLFLVVIMSSLAGYIDSRWRKDQLIRQNQENQIRFLQAQMHPHFLFNTLNTITSLVIRQPQKAEQLLINLSDFLRFNMEYSQQRTVQLKEEITFLENYLNLVKARFGDKLTWHITVSPDCENYQIPTLLLQPLVENAVKHGWGDREQQLHIDITVLIIHPDILLEIKDNGCGFERSKMRNFPPPGHALDILQKQVKLISGRDKTITIHSRPQEGTQITVKLPL